MIAVDDMALERAILSCEADPPYERGRLFFDELGEHTFESLESLQSAHPGLQFCYSVKTNPRREILDLAREHGAMAEVISPEEFDHALECGFEPGRIVYNGPFPAVHCTQAPGFIFADSVQAFVSAVQRFTRTTVGVRLRPPHVDSRFGLDAEGIDRFVQALKEGGERRTCVSFHVRPQDYGSYSWRSLVETVIDIAARIESASAASIVAFDVGGGLRPAEFDAAIANGNFEWLRDRVRSRLPAVRTIFCEPGQAVATGLEAVVAPVLEVRNRSPQLDVIVNAGFPDVPQIASFEHRLFLLREGRLSLVRHGGGSRILGRTCLEHDVLANNALLQNCGTGDAIVIADAGAYDASMEFAFSQGERIESIR